MASLADYGLGGLPSPNMSDLFGYRGASSGNQIGAVTAQQVAGVPPLAPHIAAMSTNPNANAANATLYPTSKGAQAFREYALAAYPDGKMPARIRELMDAATRGGINDMGLAVAMSADVQRRKAAGTFDYGERIGGLGGGAPLQAIEGDSYLEGVLKAPVKLARAQNAAALGPTGPGVFAPLLAAASLFTPLSPVVPGLFSTYRGAVEKDPFQAIGGIGTIGAASGAFDGLSNVFSDGFVNPDALDFTGARTGANALGLTSPGQWSGLQNIGVLVNPSAIATPLQIADAINYTPVSLGGQPSSSGSIGDTLKAAKQLLPFVSEPEQPQQGGLLSQGISQTTPNPYSPLRAPAPPDPLRYFRLETRAR